MAKRVNADGEKVGINMHGLYNKDFSQIHGNRCMTPQQLFEFAKEYFEWAENNPLHVPETAKYEGKMNETLVTKIRPFTIYGLCTYLCIERSTFHRYQNDEAYRPVFDWINDIIKEQKFAGGMVGIFHAGMVMRDLGMVDKQDVNVTSTKELDDLMSSIEEDHDE